MIYAYCRVSTENQTGDNQLQSIERYCKNHSLVIDHVINVKVSSRSKDRDLSFISELRPGDILVVSQLDRLGRSVFELVTIINQIQSAKAELIIIDKNLIISADKHNITSTIVVTTLSLVAQIERNLISERTCAALARIRLTKKLGRPVKDESLLRSNALVLKGEGLNITEISSQLGVSRQRIYRAIKAS